MVPPHHGESVAILAEYDPVFSTTDGYHDIGYPRRHIA
jgi:hypothetical protein